MSDTPRTDKALEDRHEPESGLVWGDFARTLEREGAALKAAAKSLVDEVASHTLSQGRVRNAVYADGVVCRVATLEALRKLVESPECRHDSEAARILCSRITDMETMESKAVMDWIAEVKTLRARLESAKSLLSDLVQDGKALDQSDCNHANLAVRWQSAEQFISKLP